MSLTSGYIAEGMEDLSDLPPEVLAQLTARARKGLPEPRSYDYSGLLKVLLEVIQPGEAFSRNVVIVRFYRRTGEVLTRQLANSILLLARTLGLVDIDWKFSINIHHARYVLTGATHVPENIPGDIFEAAGLSGETQEYAYVSTL